MHCSADQVNVHLERPEGGQQVQSLGQRPAGECKHTRETRGDQHDHKHEQHPVQ